MVSQIPRFQVKRTKWNERSQKDHERKTKLPLVINGAVQTQIAVRHEEQAVNHAHVKIGLHNAVHVFQGHGDGKQQVADAFQQRHNPESAKWGFLCSCLRFVK